MSAKVSRPSGITVLAVLDTLVGLALLFTGLVIFPSFLFLLRGATNLPSDMPPIWPIVLGVIGAFSLVAGLLCLVDAYGLWTRKSWARMLGIALAVLVIIFGFAYSFTIAFSISGIFSDFIVIIPEGIIIYYLTRPNIVHFFSAPKPPSTSA